MYELRLQLLYLPPEASDDSDRIQMEGHQPGARVGGIHRCDLYPRRSPSRRWQRSVATHLQRVCILSNIHTQAAWLNGVLYSVHALSST